MNPPYIHDHFEGSAHCVECEGLCKLTGAERTATDLARWLCEGRAYANSGLNMSEMSTLRGAGIDPDALMNRARATK